MSQNSRSQARSAARLGAVQALYQQQMEGTRLAKLLDEFHQHRLGRVIEDEEYAEADVDFFDDIVRGVEARREEIDGKLTARLAEGWIGLCSCVEVALRHLEFLYGVLDEHEQRVRVAAALAELGLGHALGLDGLGREGEKVVARENRSTALDSLNLLYVGCTRAVSQLHLISREVTKKPSKPTYDYLLQEFMADQLESERIPESFYWSQEVPPLAKKTEKKAVVQYASSSNSEWRKRLLVKRHTDQAARDFGILIHDLLGRIKDSSQLQIVLAEAQREGRFQAEEYSKIEELIQEVINHPQLLTAFDSESKMWIERDIMLRNGKSIRPDRVVLTDDQAVLIDFKTGSPQKKDKTQIRSYSDTIADMGYHVVSKLLVYIGTTLEVKSV